MKRIFRKLSIELKLLKRHFYICPCPHTNIEFTEHAHKNVHAALGVFRPYGCWPLYVLLQNMREYYKTNCKVIIAYASGVFPGRMLQD